MRSLRGLGLALALAWALAPEFSRYRPPVPAICARFERFCESPERELRVASGALRIVLTRPGEVADPPGALERIAQVATSAADGLPGDPRPWILAGSARLVAGEPDRAIDHYRQALALGERPETVLNLGRAYEALGQTEKARAAYVRALWVSPALLPALLPDVAQPLSAEVARLEAQLRAGRLKAPPPLPDEVVGGRW